MARAGRSLGKTDISFDLLAAKRFPVTELLMNVGYKHVGDPDRGIRLQFVDSSRTGDGFLVGAPQDIKLDLHDWLEVGVGAAFPAFAIKAQQLWLVTEFDYMRYIGHGTPVERLAHPAEMRVGLQMNCPGYKALSLGGAFQLLLNDAGNGDLRTTFLQTPDGRGDINFSEHVNPEVAAAVKGWFASRGGDVFPGQFEGVFHEQRRLRHVADDRAGAPTGHLTGQRESRGVRHLACELRLAPIVHSTGTTVPGIVWADDKTSPHGRRRCPPRRDVGGGRAAVTRVQRRSLQSPRDVSRRRPPRGAGGRDARHEIAARYIASQFALLGVKPAGTDGTYYEKADFVESALTGPPPTLEIEGGGKTQTFRQGDKAFIVGPLDGGAVDVRAPLVFAGYGMTDTVLAVDDYAGLDVKGKIAVVLWGLPNGMDSEIGAHLQSDQAHTAAEHGAVGVIRIAVTIPWATVEHFGGHPFTTWVQKDGRRSIQPVASKRQPSSSRPPLRRSSMDCRRDYRRFSTQPAKAHGPQPSR